MYEEIIKELSTRLNEKEITKFKSKTIHLGIFAEPYLSLMIEGKKIVESRFSKNKLLPYEKITKDDIVLVKKSGGDILAYFTIKDIKFYNLKDTPIAEIRNKYSKELCVDESFWQMKKDSNYATLIFIDKLVSIKPFHICKKGMNTWLSFAKH